MHNFQNEGLDIISKSIKNKKCWQPYQTQLISLILNEGNFTFIDIGCHIGYYSLLAHSLNNKVISIEDNKNYYNVFNKTIVNNNIIDISNNYLIIDSLTKKESLPKINTNNIQLLRSCFHGHEIYIMNLYKKYFKKKLIKYIIFQISPKLKSGYPLLCKYMNKYGYNICDIETLKNNNVTNLNNLIKYKLDINNINNYINNLKYNQSFFLFF